MQMGRAEPFQRLLHKIKTGTRKQQKFARKVSGELKQPEILVRVNSSSNLRLELEFG